MAGIYLFYFDSEIGTSIVDPGFTLLTVASMLYDLSRTIRTEDSGDRK